MEDILMSNAIHPLLVLVAGPYRSGTNDDPVRIAVNMQAMNTAALQVWQRGHVPVTGEALALPLIESAGSQQPGDEIFTAIMHPLSRILAERCDAVLRIGGPSQGADEMVSIARQQSRPVFYRVADIPEYRRD
jgi:hypothetical protein